MALQVWLPLNGNLNNQGLSDITVTNSGATFDNNGKIGKCLKTANQSIDLKYIPDLNNKSLSIGGWFKFNKAEIQAIITSKANITEKANACTGNLIGNNSYGGFGLIYSTNNLYDSNKELSSISIYPYIRTSTEQKSTNSFSIIFDTWYHIFAIWDNENRKLKLYRNGVLYSSGSVGAFSDAVSRNLYFNSNYIGGGNGPGLSIPFYSNDVRIYDHALSPKEVEVLSRGLICHYPLSDRSNQTPNNVATYPTFDTSSGHGGWNHWGNTGNLGHYSQNTNSQYIFRPGQAYSHCFSDESTATAPYLLYQSPSFNGGYRSLCAIIKEENGVEIKESIVYPVWNAPVSGSIPQGKWTSITPLGNGFYLGKVEGFQQDGSNNLVGLYVRAGYTVYVSEFYIENDRKVCSDFFYPSTTVYDTSGFKNNGETYAYDTTGSIECSSDTAKYSLSTFINSANVTNNATGIRYIYGNCELTTPQYLTVAFWCKPIAGYGGVGYANNGIFALTNNDIGTGAASDYSTAPMHNRDADIDMSTSTNVHRIMAFRPTVNEWHHYAVVYDGRYGRAYKDGVQTFTLDMGSNLSLASFKAIVIGYSHAGGVYRKVQAYYSDFRLYATALSDEQVAELYNTAVSVANNGTLMGYELVEV